MEPTFFFHSIFYPLCLYLYFAGISILVVQKLLPFLERNHNKKEFRRFIIGVLILISIPLGITHFEIVKLHNTTLWTLRNLLSLWFLVVLIVTLFSWPITRYIFIPLGCVRAAFYGGLLSKKTFAFDAKGGALFTCVWALLRKKKPTPKEIQFIEEKIKNMSLWKGAGLIAYAFFRNYQKDSTSALFLLQTIDTIDSHLLPPHALKEAITWLVAHSFEQHDMKQAHELCQFWRKEGGSKIKFLDFVASASLSERKDDSQGPSRFWFYTYFLQSGIPFHFLSSFQNLIYQRKKQDFSLPEIPVSFSSLEQALFLDSYLQKKILPDPFLFATVVQKWEEALADKKEFEWIWQRCFSLGISNGDEIISQFKQQVTTSLVQQVIEKKITLISVDPVAPNTIQQNITLQSLLYQEIKQQVQNQLLSNLEFRCDNLRKRTESKRPLPCLEEWHEWGLLRSCYQEALSIVGPDIHYLAWSQFHTDVCNFGVWLWNVRKERILANAIFRWLLKEATLLQDEQGIDLQTKNVNCGWE